jgi:hypothetical protein
MHSGDPPFALNEQRKTIGLSRLREPRLNRGSDELD